MQNIKRAHCHPKQSDSGVKDLRDSSPRRLRITRGGWLRMTRKRFEMT